MLPEYKIQYSKVSRGKMQKYKVINDREYQVIQCTSVHMRMQVDNATPTRERSIV